MAVTAMAGGTDNNQHKIGSKDMVAVGTAMETAAPGAATTAMGMPTTALGIGADGIAFAAAAGAETTAVGAEKFYCKHGKDGLALLTGSNTHSAVLAPLVGGGTCTTFPVGSRGGGGHDERVVGAGCDGCVWGYARWLCVCCKPLLFC
jgi:hypothetical protein